MKIHHLAFRTRDLARLERFYVDVLGLRVTRRQEARSVWLAIGDGVLMLESASDAEPTVAQSTMELVAFAIAQGERASFAAKLALAGVAIEGETEHTMYFRDPDGRRVALSHYAHRADA